jgi:hypothetical protein
MGDRGIIMTEDRKFSSDHRAVDDLTESLITVLLLSYVHINKTLTRLIFWAFGFWHVLRNDMGKDGTYRPQPQSGQTAMQYHTNDSSANVLTNHAHCRMKVRGISDRAIAAIMTYGLEVPMRGALVYALDHQTVREWSVRGVYLARFLGIHVVCAEGGAVLTTYRNKHMRGFTPVIKRFARAA